MEELHLTVDDRPRRAVVQAPRAGTPMPVVILLHGSGGSGEWAVNEARWDDKAAAEGILLVAPDATRPKPDSPPRFYTNPAVWNDGSGRPPADGVAGVDDVGFLRTVLEELPRRWPVDEERIYVTGFSNGAGMTFRLARDLAGRIAAIAAIAGYDPGGPRPKRPVPTLFMIGTLDPLVPVDGGVVSTPWAESQHRPPIHEMLARWVADNGEPAATEFIEGLGHHWPGGRAELNRRIAGPPSNSIDATAAVWDFFKSRRR
jgi:polyhydroxybutyrate depolymerase